MIKKALKALIWLHSLSYNVRPQLRKENKREN